MIDKVIVYKSDRIWDRKNPFIVQKGEIRASFKTRKEAEKFRPKMKKAWISTITDKIYLK